MSTVRSSVQRSIQIISQPAAHCGGHFSWIVDCTVSVVPLHRALDCEWTLVVGPVGWLTKHINTVVYQQSWHSGQVQSPAGIENKQGLHKTQGTNSGR